MANSRMTMGPAQQGNLSMADQLMQIDSAITSTLQEIDANFARAHQIVTATLLPAVKVYGQHSAKTWQSARFWQQFFITATQVPVRGAEEAQADEDYDANDQTGYEETSSQRDQSGDYSDGRDPRRGDQEDDSGDSRNFFSSVKNAKASSPFPRSSNGRQRENGNDSQASWASVESPFDRLKKEVEASPNSNGQRARGNDGADDDSMDLHKKDLAKGMEGMKLSQRSVRSPAKIGRGTGSTPKLLNKVLDNEQRRADKQKTPGKASTARTSRSGAAPGSSKWHGTVDLSQTPLSAIKTAHIKGGTSSKKGKTTRNEWDDDDDDSLALPPGMSPPVTMRFSVPQKRYAQTPAKEAARMFLQDTLRDAEAGPATIARRQQQDRLLDKHDEASPSAASKQLQKGIASNSMVGTPLKKGPLGKVKGPQNRRSSMPTPPTLTRPMTAPRPAGAASTAVPGSVASSAAGSSRAAMLLDADESGSLPELRAGPTCAATAGDSDSESDSDDDDSSEDSRDIGIGSGPPPSNQGSVSKSLSTFSATSSLASASKSGWTTSSNATRPVGASNLDNDTLFGVGGSKKPRGAGGNDFRMIGQVDATVQGGDLLADKDVTFSAPSPTPWK